MKQNNSKMVDFYYTLPSPPCRSIIMAAKALGVELNKKTLDMSGGEHLKPEYLKINPQHTIPTIVDDGFALWESRAILIYLAEKYGKDDTLYPKCPKKQAKVNQILNFDMGTLYKSFADYYYPQFKNNAPADPALFKKIEEALGFLEIFLESNKFVAGDNLTIADIAILATMSTVVACNFDISKYPSVHKWYENAKQVTPGWAENWEGCLALKARFEAAK